MEEEDVVVVAEDGKTTLLLNSEEVEGLLTMEACLEALEEAFRELATGQAVNRPRSDIFTPTSERDVYYRYKTMEGAVPGLGVLAQRINSERIRWPLVNGIRRQDKFQRVYPNHYVGLVLLFSIETGGLLAIIKEAYLQKMRVGGTSGLGIKYLARENASKVGILGSGWQAEAQLMAACTVRKIEHIKVFSPNADNRESFASRMSKKLGIRVEPKESPQEVAKDVDILLTATNAMTPVLNGDWIEEGTHVSSVNPKRELDPKTLDSSDYIVVSIREVNWSIHVGGPREGIAPLKDKAFDISAYPDIGEVIVGKSRGRTHQKEKTLFLSTVGLGIQFAAVASKIYQEAKKRGWGQEVPSEWFMETVRK